MYPLFSVVVVVVVVAPVVVVVISNGINLATLQGLQWSVIVAHEIRVTAVMRFQLPKLFQLQKKEENKNETILHFLGLFGHEYPFSVMIMKRFSCSLNQNHYLSYYIILLLLLVFEAFNQKRFTSDLSVNANKYNLFLLSVLINALKYEDENKLKFTSPG